MVSTYYVDGSIPSYLLSVNNSHENKIYLEECFMYLNDMNSKRDFFDKTKPFYDEKMKTWSENKQKAL